MRAADTGALPSDSGLIVTCSTLYARQMGGRDAPCDGRLRALGDLLRRSVGLCPQLALIPVAGAYLTAALSSGSFAIQKRRNKLEIHRSWRHRGAYARGSELPLPVVRLPQRRRDR